MGWSFGWDTRKEIVAHLTREQHGSGKTWKKLAFCYRGNVHSGVLWSVVAIIEDATGKEIDRFIECDLLERRGGEWGYKDLDEGCGPCYFSCPLSYLDMTPVPDSPYAAGWREKVREYHAKRNVKIVTGQTYPAAPGVRVGPDKVATITVTSQRPLMGKVTLEGGHTLWDEVKIKRRHLAIEPTPALAR